MSTDVPIAVAGDRSKVKIAIDAGHGMDNTGNGKYDSGADGNGFEEADIALILAFTLKFIFEEKGIDFFMLRSYRAQDAPLNSRPARAIEAACSHYLALHMNDADDESANGCEAYYRDENDKALARVCVHTAVGAFGTANRGVKSESDSQHTSLKVFDFDGPCTLIEFGFMSNTNDINLVMDRDKRIAFAEALAVYFKSLEEG